MTSKKTVRFTEDTADPPIPKKCFCCGHRNISPKIRDIDLCMECFEETCEVCKNDMGICWECLDKHDDLIYYIEEYIHSMDIQDEAVL